MSVVVRALRVALGAPRRTAALTADGGASGVPAKLVTDCGGGATCALGAPSGGTVHQNGVTEADSAAIWLLYIVDFLVESSDDRGVIRLLVDNDAFPVIITALRMFSSYWQGLGDLQEVFKSICDVISAALALDTSCQSILLAADLVPALVSAILQPGQAVPTSAFVALTRVLTPRPLVAPVIVEAVGRDLSRIVDVVFYILKMILVDFDKEDEDDVTALVHAGRLLVALVFFVNLKRDLAAECDGVVSSALTLFSALLYGDDEPERLPALVNALRASALGIADSDDSQISAYAFAEAISCAINGAGRASCRAAVEAGVIPALLMSLRKHGESSAALASSASVALRKLQLRARQGCCSERIVSELSMRGTTTKLLRRLRDVWISKAASSAAKDDATAEEQGNYRNAETAVDMLSAILADMTGHA